MPLSIHKRDVGRYPDTRCPICLDHITCATVVQCGHTFCENCIAAWLEEKRGCPTCPTCRSMVHGRPVRSLLLDDLLTERLRETLSANDFEEWREKTVEFIRLKKEFEDAEHHTRKRKRYKEIIELVVGTIQLVGRQGAP
jgi:hypothetical protein